MKVADLFPPCPLGACKLENAHRRKDGSHAHILPHQLELINSTEKFVASVGGYGSGKTLPACVLGVLLSLSVPGNMGIVCRRSLPKLHDSTERIFLEVLDRAGVAWKGYEKRDGWYHRIVLEQGSEISFRETKDLGRFLGPEYGWAYIDEAQEEPEKTFKDLTGRLRLPRASQYLKLFITTNPPSQQHWIALRWPAPGVWYKQEKVGDVETSTSYRMIQTSTLANPFLTPEYVADLKLTHSDAEIKRILSGLYGFTHDGKGVYSELFDHGHNVGEPKVLPITMLRSWDFGFHMPVCHWHQMWKCKHKTLHWSIQRELLGEDCYAEDFATLVLAKTREWFPTQPKSMIQDCGDHAGTQINDRGPGPCIRLAKPPWNLHFKTRKTHDIDPGLDLIRTAMKTKCKCGQYQLVVHRQCPQTIETLAGGYHFPRQTVGLEIRPKPQKDGYYDNIADSIRYAGENFFRPANRDDNVMDELTRVQGEGHTSSEPERLAWLGDAW